MLKMTFTTIKPPAGNAIILPVSSWVAAREIWTELNELSSSDWPETGKTRLLNKGAGSAYFLMNINWAMPESSQAFKAALKELNAHHFEKAFYFYTDSVTELRKIACEAADAFYSFEAFIAQKKEQHFNELHFFGDTSSPEIEAEIALGQNIAKALRTTKTLAETPANYCTPSDMAKKAHEIATQCQQMTAEVLGREAITNLKMNSFLSVAQGSAHEPQFIIMTYTPAQETGAPVVFVGKGITFDTGGHSLKPANSMMGMKFDMSGGATVLGLFDFLSQHPVNHKVIGLVPCCENIPGGLANKPDDVVTSMSGQTIEILNTDAEGRLILCDALTYAERYTPRYVVDVATLTGSCMATFGAIASGLMGNSPELIDKLKGAAFRTGDKVWELPLWKEWHQELKSPVADMANIGSNYSGAIIAGCFLEKFAGAYQWAHLDIAGTACSTHGHKRGATGRPLPLLIDFLLQLEQEESTQGS